MLLITHVCAYHLYLRLQFIQNGSIKKKIKNTYTHAPFLGIADIHNLFNVLFAIKNSSWIQLLLLLLVILQDDSSSVVGSLAPALTPRSLKERQRVAAWPRSTKMRAKLRRTALLQIHQILRSLIRFNIFSLFQFVHRSTSYLSTNDATFARKFSCVQPALHLLINRSRQFETNVSIE